MRKMIDLNVALGLEDLDESDVEDIVGNEQEYDIEQINLCSFKVPKVEEKGGDNNLIDLNISEDYEEKNEHEVEKNQLNDTNEVNMSGDKESNSESLVNELENRLAVGSIVSDLDHVFLLYCEYAQYTGFSVRKADQRYIGQTQEIRWKEYKCSCTGFPDGKSSDGRVATYKKQITRTNCKAKLRVSRVQHGAWKVTLFEKIHNHELVPADQNYLIRSARHLSHAKKSIIEAMNSVGIGVSRACRYMENECGGPQNVGFTRKDVYAHMEKKKKETKVDNVDANALMQYFINKSNTEPFFYWNVQLDDDGRLMNFFFRDSRCAIDFDAFGDVLSIDTTYRTNKYNLICAPFIGINHHRRNVMFALAFMSDETSESFQWLFETFVESMSGKHPKIIFTDQSRAMMKAIDQVFPNAYHRLCQWHINKNAPSHFGSLNNNGEFKNLWHKCMDRCDTEAEFEESWHQMIETYQLQDHKWFTDMYKLRSRWATVFTNTLFTAGLKATSRSEVTNKVLKDLCVSSGSLYDFVRHYEQTQANWRCKEGVDDTSSIWLPGQFIKKNPLLMHAAEVYTRNVYKIFEFEIAYSLNIIIREHPVDYGAEFLEFNVSSCTVGSRLRKVSYNKISRDSSCSCRTWETEGILCRHILRVYFALNVDSIPDQYILERWRNSAKCRINEPVDGEKENKSNIVPYMTFVNEIMRSVYDMSASAKDHRGARELIRKQLGVLRHDLSTLLSTASDVNDNVRTDDFESRFQDPAKIVSHWDAKKKKKKRVVGSSIGGHDTMERKKKKKKNDTICID